MSLLWYFAKANVVPSAEETGIGEKPTAEANKRVAEVLERQRLGQSTSKGRATVHSEEAQVKIGKYTSINGTASARRHFKKELGDFPESTVQKYKQLYEKEVSACAKSGDFCNITALPPKKRG